MQRAELFSTSATPFQGVFSAKHPTVLTPGQFYDVQNLRYTNDTLQVRNGIKEIAGTTGLPGTFTVLGVSDPVMLKSTKYFVYIAVNNPTSGEVEIYQRSYTTTSDTWSDWYQITAASLGTEPSLPRDGNITFTVIDGDRETRLHLTDINTQTGPVVIAAGGEGSPIYISSLSTPSVVLSRAYPINAIDPPKKLRGHTPSVTFRDATNIKSGSLAAVVDTGTTMTPSISGSSPTQSLNLTSGATPNPGDAGHFTFPAIDLLNQDNNQSVPQLGLIVQASDESWWESVKIEAQLDEDGAGPAWVVIHDPNQLDGGSNPLPVDNRIEVATDTAGYTVVAFGLPDRSHLSTWTCSGLKFTVIATKHDAAISALSGATTLDIHWVYASGFVPGTAQYAVCFRSARAETDSAGVVLPISGFGQTTAGLRDKFDSFRDGTTVAAMNARVRHIGAWGANVPDDFVFPLNPQLYYEYHVPTMVPSEDQIGNNADMAYVDSLSVYRKDPGDSEFWHVADKQVATQTTSSGFGNLGRYKDETAPEEKDFIRRVPDAFSEPMPSGRAMLYVNNRLFVGGVRSSSSADSEALNVIKISEEGQPFRFRSFARFDDKNNFDPSSGYYARIGMDTIQSFVSSNVGAVTPGVSSIFCLTDKAMYSIDKVNVEPRVFDIRKVSSNGAIGRHSAAESARGLFFSDTDNFVRFWEQNISERVVQDKLNAIPSAERTDVQTTIYRDRLYMAYASSPSSGNDVVAVYNILLGMWESFDSMPSGVAVAAWIKYQHQGDSALWFMGTDGKTYEYEAAGQTTDDGTAISVLLETGELHNRMFEPIVAQHFGLVGTPVTTVLTTERVFSEPSSTVTGELDLDTGTTLAWKYDTLSGGGTPGGEGLSVRLRITGDFTVAFELLALVAEVEGVEFGGASG